MNHSKNGKLSDIHRWKGGIMLIVDRQLANMGMDLLPFP